MAAQTNREVTLTLTTETNGTQSVRALADELRKLGKEGGAAAPEFERLSAELDNLAQQQDLVSEFNQITTAITDARAAMGQATDAANREQAALAQLSTALDQAKQAEAAHAAQVRAANQARDEANQAYRAAIAAMSQYKAEIGSSKGANEQERVALREKRQAILDTKAAYDAAKQTLSQLAPAQTELAQATRAASDALKAQKTVVKAATSAAASTKQQYDTLGASLDKTRQSLTQLGVDTKNVAAEQNRITQALASTEQQARTLQAALPGVAGAAKQVGSELDAAFAQVGLRSTNQIKAEILAVNQALMKLANDTRVSGAEFDAAFAAGQKRIQQLNAELRRAGGEAQTFGSRLGDAFRQFTPAAIAINAVTRGIDFLLDSMRQIPRVTAEFESMGRALTILTGSTSKAREEFAYLQRVANHVGGDVKALGDAYINLTAATKGTNMEGAQTRRTFEAVAGAMGALGKSSAETEGALRAISQMVSKGTVSMEEMRQQLAERLPAAMQVTAKKLGITVEELTALISTGQLTASEVLPALTKGLEELYQTHKQNDTLAGQWAQTENAAKSYGNAIGETVLKPMLAFGRFAAASMAAVGEGFLFASRTVGVLGAELFKSRDWARALGYLAESAREVDQRVSDLAGTSENAAKTTAQLVAEAKAAGQEFVTLADGSRHAVTDLDGASDSMVKFMVSSNKAMTSAENFSTAARKAAEATRAAGEAAITTANALGTEAEKRTVAAQVARDNAAALEALANAERAELAILEERIQKMAEQYQANARLDEVAAERLRKLGEEISTRRVEVEGLDRQTEAYRLLAVARDIETQKAQNNANVSFELRERYLALDQAVRQLEAAERAGLATSEQVKVAKEERSKVSALYTDALRDELRETEAVAAISGREKDARDAALQAAQLQLQAIRDLNQGRSDEARALELQVVQLQVERREMEDNSRIIGQLASEYQKAKAAVEALRAAQASGKDVTEELAAAELKLAEASRLYADAARDQQNAIQANLSIKQNELEITRLGIQSQIESLRTVAEVARAKGDEKAAIAALNEIKKLEIELARITAQMKRAEGEAALALVEAKRQELEATGELTETKRRELQAQELAAKAKMKEAEIADKVADRMEKLNKASQGAADGIRESGSAADETASSFDRMGDSADAAAAKVERLGAGVKKIGANYYNADNMWSDAQGNVQTMEIPTWLSTFNTLKSGGMDDDTARKAASKYFDEKDNYLIPNAVTWQDYRPLSMLLNEEISAYQRAGGKKADSSGPSAPATPKQPSAAATNTAQTLGLGLGDPTANGGDTSTRNLTGFNTSGTTINITVPSGDRKTINVASPRDAEQVRKVIDQLVAEKSRSEA